MSKILILILLIYIIFPRKHTLYTAFFERKDDENDSDNNKMFYNAQDAYDCLCGDPPLRASSFGDIIDDERWVVEQCAGLKDKKGKLIYEGNIVKDDIGLIAPVCFDEVNAMFYIDRYIGVYNYPFAYFYHYDSEEELEVIGNIHENADLLENEE